MLAGTGGGSGGSDTFAVGGGGGGGGGSFGGAIFIDSGTATIINSWFLGNYTTGGLGGTGPASTGGSGTAFLGGIFTRSGTIAANNSAVNILTTNTPTEIWTIGTLRYRAPIGMPRVSADGQFAPGNIVRRTPTQISLQSTLPLGTIVYSLGGSDPRTNSTLYAGPFVVQRSAILRALAYNSNFTFAVEMDPAQITILPRLIANTLGGGTISILPAEGPYFSNSVAQISAIPDSGFTFLEWIGDASGTNTTTTVVMSRDKYVQALFGTPIGTTVIGAGSVNVDPSSPLYPYGATIRITGLPQPGSYLAQWGASASGTNNPVEFVVSNSNPTVAAVFSTLTGSERTLTVLEGGHGRVSPNPAGTFYNSGQIVTLTATPDPGQDFLGWGGAANGDQNPLIVTMNTNKLITATFSKKPSLRAGTPLEGLVEDGFRITLTGEFGALYNIWGSTNLHDWSMAGTATNTFGILQFTDQAATNLPLRYYRATSE